jgi:hypothetical protein
VQVLGVDQLDGLPQAVRAFSDHTGATYPFWLEGNKPTGGVVEQLYAYRHHFVVINKQGIVRYNSDTRYDYPSGFRLNEIRATVDSLVTTPAGVDDFGASRLALRVGPNPFRGRLEIELVRPYDPQSLALRAPRHARVDVHDLSGRRVATLWNGVLEPHVTRMTWESGTLAPGLYLVRVNSEGARFTRRVALVR